MARSETDLHTTIGSQHNHWTDSTQWLDHHTTIGSFTHNDKICDLAWAPSLILAMGQAYKQNSTLDIWVMTREVFCLNIIVAIEREPRHALYTPTWFISQPSADVEESRQIPLTPTEVKRRKYYFIWFYHFIEKLFIIILSFCSPFFRF